VRDFSIDLVWTKIELAAAAMGGWLGYFLGGMDGLLIALVVFMGIDYLTGIMCAIAEKQLSSAVGFRGICKKVLILLLVGLAHIVDMHVVGTGSALRGAVICFYLANEGLSLTENAARLGLPIPEKLKTVLSQLHNRTGETTTTADLTKTNTKEDE
jgi:toxin secretion/phage lysis holin